MKAGCHRGVGLSGWSWGTILANTLVSDLFLDMYVSGVSSMHSRTKVSQKAGKVNSLLILHGASRGDKQ